MLVPVGSVEQLVAEDHSVAWVACATESTPDGGLHAGRTETSLMLHLRPDDVRLDRAEAGAVVLASMVAEAVAAGEKIRA